MTDLAAARPVRISLTGPQATPDTSALLWEGADPTAAAVILAHGAGTDMTHHLMRRHVADLVAAGHPAALFNFAYTEVGRSRPDPAPRLESAWRDVIAQLGPLLGGDRPLVIGGRSMGGRIASMVAADGGQALGVAGVVCLAYPLHPPGRPEQLRIGHWPALEVPILLVCGTRDAMAPPDALHANIDAHMPSGLATLHPLVGADHSFRVRKKDGRTQEEVLVECARTMTTWLQGLTRSPSAQR